MEKDEKIASDIFKQFGLSFESAERAEGWTNSVWLNGDLVLRLSNVKDSDKIRYEIERSKMFPHRSDTQRILRSALRMVMNGAFQNEYRGLC